MFQYFPRLHICCQIAHFLNERGREGDRERDTNLVLYVGVSFVKERFCLILCSAVQLRALVFLTDHSGMLHKYCLIKCVCLSLRVCGRKYSPSTWTLAEIGAICPSIVPCFPAHFLWMKIFFFLFVFFSWSTLDENSEPELLCQEDTERKREGIRKK